MTGLFLGSLKTRLAIAAAVVVPSLCMAQGAAPSADRRVEGQVVDQQALPVPGAQIVVTQQQGGLRKTAVSSTEPFRIDGLAPAVYDVRVDAPGFAPKIETVDLRTALQATLDIRLETAGVAEEVVVTATRSEQRVGDVAASMAVVDNEEIKRSPAVIADDVLRQSPTFSLFRRTSSLSSHPTSQGVSLRGIGPSGTSRTLVLIDDVPFNDPFGGWVYWTRVPLISVDRMELVNGSASSLYGTYAMGGVINIVTRQPERRTFEIRPQYGSKTSPKVDFFASDRWSKLGAAVEGSIFNTDGFPIVAPVERGPIDNNATVDYRNISAKLQYSPTDRVSAFVRGGYFTEDRVNAKVGEVNDTEWTFFNGGVQVRLPDESNLQARVFADDQTFHATFLAVTNPTTTRNIVRLATDQLQPIDGVGSLVQWSKAIGSSHTFSAGTDWRWVDGDSEDDSFVAAAPSVVVGVTQQAVQTTHRVAGGTQRNVGVFLQDIFSPIPKLAITLNARVDSWRNYDAHSLETTAATGLPTANNRPSLPDKENTVVSPRVAAIYHVNDRVSAWGDFGLGFRAPTLNELYRQFSVGGTTTRPNDQLGPERLKGGEAGISVVPVRERFRREHHDRYQPPAATEPRPHTDLGHPDGSRLPRRLVLDLFGRLSLRSSQGGRERAESGPRRKISAAGARTPRDGTGGVSES
jgi:outer membrane receptor protein involved in Fe transport